MGAAGMRRDWLGWLVGWTDYSFIWELIFQFVREPRGAAHCLSTFGWVLIKIVTFIIVISPTYSLSTAGTRQAPGRLQGPSSKWQYRCHHFIQIDFNLPEKYSPPSCLVLFVDGYVGEYPSVGRGKTRGRSGAWGAQNYFVTALRP